MGLAIAMSLGLTACRTTECPAKPEQVDLAALRQSIGPDLVVGTAIVHRFVDSPDAEYRGYDISITSPIEGLGEAEQVMFVSLQTPLPSIELGADVLVVGQRGPRVAEIRPAGCPVLTPLAP